MSKKDKLIDRLLKKPKDFTFDEMESLLSYFGYELKQGGTGFGVKFIKGGSNEAINLLLFTANRSQIPIKNIFPLYVFYHVRHETDSFIYFL